MALKSPRPIPRRNPVKVGVVPAPLGGVDGRISLAANDLSKCPYAYNMVPDEYGMRLRKGYREHVIEVEDTASTGVGSIIPFEGIDSGDDMLFCANNEGIWDITAYDTAPTKKVAFTVNNTASAGFGQYINYVNTSGAQFLLYADTLNGLFTYTQSTDTWAQTTGVTGVAEEDICGIVVHKLRVWLIERDSTSAWYMPVDAIAGTATEFTFGGKFKHGGKLVGLYNWTLDGGAGVDDYLVAVSSSGDVLVYQGEDPSSASTWSLRGSYYIGEIPKGYRAGLEFSADLYLLSAYGLVSMTDTLNGVRPSDPRKDSLPFKISQALQTSMKTLRDENGWDIKFLASEGAVIIVSPVQADGTYLNYVVNMVNDGWGFWRGPPILSIDVWNNNVYFGTADNRIFVMDIYRDEQLITPAGAVNGDPIEYSILHSFSDMGSPGQNKRAVFVRPNFRAIYEPVFDTKILYDYNIDEFSPNYTIIPSTASLWDTAVWDAAVWSATEKSSYNRVSGSAGFGRAMAVAIRGKAEEDTLLVSTDIGWNEGGMM